MKLEKNHSLRDYMCAEEVVFVCRQRAKTHNNYRHYTSLKTIENTIISPPDGLASILLTTGYNWNDVKDRRNFNCFDEETPADIRVVNFGKCFSCSGVESVAMWKIYAGNDGGMIKFDKRSFNKMIDSIKPNNIEIGYMGKGEKNQDAYIACCTLSEHDYDLYLTDVVYCGPKVSKSEDNDTWICRFNGKKSVELETDCLNQLSVNRKSLCWEYEQECRLVVSIKQNAIEEIIKRKTNMYMHNPDFIKRIVVRLLIPKEDMKCTPYVSPYFKCADGKQTIIQPTGDYLRSEITDELSAE